MIPQGSRYELADKAFVQAHIYDIYENAVFEDTTPPMLRFHLANRDATYLVTTLPLPPPPPAEYYAKDQEHMPFLAFKFMEDSTQWWRIADANPNIWYPLDLAQGAYMRIPS
jgi:hypothetical protein